MPNTIQYLEIDSVNRKITLPADLLLGVLGDKNVERVHFRVKKMVGDNINLAQHQIYVKYVASLDMYGENFAEEMPGMYYCDDVTDNGDTLTFSWKMGANVFKTAGFIAFSVLASDGEITRWNTRPAVGAVKMTIPGGLPEVAEKYPDVITQLLNRMDAVEAIATPQAMQNYVDTYLTTHPVQLDSTLKDPKKAAPADVVGTLKEDLTKLDSQTSDIQSALISQKASGNPIQAKDSAKFPIKNLRLFGKSEQIVSDGNNLAFDTVYNSVLAQFNPLVTCSFKLEVGKKYTITVKTPNSNIYAYINLPQELNIKLISPSFTHFMLDGAEKTFIIEALTTREYKNIPFISRHSATSDTMTGLIKDLMLNEGSVAKPYEPYTGGKPAPAPDNPSPITSIGDKGNINVSVDNQKLILSTPNGLASVKDVKDEITSTERIQRIGQIASYSNESITTDFMSSTGQLSVGAQVNYVLPEPIVTPLTPTELEEIKKLHTNYPSTVISNDESAHMEVTYTADTKNFILGEIAKYHAQAQAQQVAMLSLMPDNVQAGMIENDTNNILNGQGV